MLSRALAVEMSTEDIEPVVSDLTCSVLGVALRHYGAGWQPPQRQLAHHTLLMCTGGARRSRSTRKRFG